MLNIIDTSKKIKNDTLIVTVFVKKRKWATEKIEKLETDYVRKILCSEFDIVKVLKEPVIPVANTDTKGMKTTGTWNFLIKKHENDPKINNKKRTTRNNSNNSSKKSNSIRNRMSKIANNS